MTQKAKQHEEHEGNSSIVVKNTYRQVSLMARLFLFCLLLPFFSLAQVPHTQWSAAAVSAHRYLLQFRLHQADSALALLLPTAEKAYLLNLRDLLLLAYSGNEEVYKKYKQEAPQRRRWIEAASESDPLRLFYLADMKLQEALFEIRFEDYLSGLLHLWQVNNMAQNSGSPDDVPEMLKIRGITNVLFGLAPEKYQWAVKLLGITGSIPTGMSQLAALSESDSPLAPEGKILQGYFYAYPLHELAKAEGIFRNHLNYSPNDRLARLMLATVLQKLQKGREALEVLKGNSNWEGLAAAHYLAGTLCLQKVETGTARQHFFTFIKTYKGITLKKDACTKIAISYMLEGAPDKAAAWQVKAESTGNTGAEPDKNASIMLNEMTHCPLPLLRARLYTDGGYGREAQQELNKVSFELLPVRWQGEYFYRLGRLQHLSGLHTEAIESYRRTIELTEKQGLYIGANAALQAGLLLSAEGSAKEAEKLFRLATEFANHPYKESVDAQARRQLKLLNAD